MNKRACITRSNVGSGSRSIVKFYLKPKYIGTITILYTL